MNKAIAMLTVLLLSGSVFAGILTTTTAGPSLASVTVAKEAALEINSQKIPVSLIGYGLRYKVVFKVYVGELLSSDATKFVRSQEGEVALNSLDQSRTVVLRLSFVRSVDAQTIAEAFNDALTENTDGKPAMSAEMSAAMNGFFEAVKNGGNADTGTTMVFAMQKNADKTETLFYEGSAGKVTTVTGPQGYSRTIMSLWLGVTSGGVTKLKEAMINGAP